MTPAEAEALAQRTLAAIDRQAVLGTGTPEQHVADRERVASDLDLFHEAWGWHSDDTPLSALVMEATGANLRRTAALYGVE